MISKIVNVLVIISIIVILGFIGYITLVKKSLIFDNKPPSSFKQPTIHILSPNYDAVWSIGSKQTIRLDIKSSKPSYKVGLLLKEEQNKVDGVLEIVDASIFAMGNYEFVIPKNFISLADSGYGQYGDMRIILGKYKLHVKLYDGTPCLKNCPLVEGFSPNMVTILGEDISDSFFTVVPLGIDNKFSCVLSSDCISIVSYEPPGDGHPAKTLLSCRNKYYPLDKNKGEAPASDAGIFSQPSYCACALVESFSVLQCVTRDK